MSGESGVSGDLVLRDLASLAEFKQAEVLQRATWGEDDIPDNADILFALQSEGACVAGAFEGGRMVAFVLSFPTLDPKVQHSHRLAVHPDARGLRLGSRLKWYQRDWCLARGITRIRWTYDPIRKVNASLNIAALGATANVYLDDYYGPMEGINKGVPSDRVMAEWHLDAPGVVARARGETVAPRADVTDAGETISIPQDFPALLAADPDAGLAARLALRAQLHEAFGRGLSIFGFDRTTATYHLS
ncbi:GNAT family N-acetyltransferase [Roseibium aestuarii]|uniref:GNAT family N-acetyltransferase n=1 Tax=Roseibium aestuarii TaxID=2600299 RepID=A0ABW4JX88_9HYPH|nr:GNAT family N-acetyltransferase [Roseibium aestuarii]